MLSGGGMPEVFGLGFFPKDEDFLELTESQYEEFYKQQGYTEEKIYALLPQEPRNQGYDDFGGLCVVTEVRQFLHKARHTSKKLIKTAIQSIQN